MPWDAASPAHDASPFPAGASRSRNVALTGQTLLRCSRRRHFAALARGSRRRLLALRVCRGLIQFSRARGAVVKASPNRSCPAQRGRERNHRHYRPPPIAPPATRGFGRCGRMRVLGHRRRMQRWLRLPCRRRSRRHLAGVDKSRARSFGQIWVDERQFWTERLDRESVAGEAAASGCHHSMQRDQARSAAATAAEGRLIRSVSRICRAQRQRQQSAARSTRSSPTCSPTFVSSVAAACDSCSSGSSSAGSRRTRSRCSNENEGFAARRSGKLDRAAGV
jgi:hypothetical protein